jgi:hypothetical protein
MEVVSLATGCAVEDPVGRSRIGELGVDPGDDYQEKFGTILRKRLGQMKKLGHL